MVEKSEKCLEKKVIFCILSFLSFTVFSNSEPLSPLYLIYGNSQVFYTHCSLIPYQDFFPSSCDLQFNTFEKNYTIRYSSVFSFKNNGFAIGYKRDGKNMNVISTGFGVKKENVGFGSSLNVFLKRNDPLLNLNVSSSLHLNTIIDNILLSINNISLIQEEKLAPDILLDITGKFFKPMNLYYDFSLFSNIKLKDIKKSPLNVKYDITGKAGNKSCFMYSAGYQINFVHNSISNLLNFSLGSIS